MLQVLDSSGSESVAVRLALGETQIVTKMREFLEQSGVHLDAFTQVCTNSVLNYKGNQASNDRLPLRDTGTEFC